MALFVHRVSCSLKHTYVRPCPTHTNLTQTEYRHCLIHKRGLVFIAGAWWRPLRPGGRKGTYHGVHCGVRPQGLCTGVCVCELCMCVSMCVRECDVNVCVCVCVSHVFMSMCRFVSVLLCMHERVVCAYVSSRACMWVLQAYSICLAEFYFYVQEGVGSIILGRHVSNQLKIIHLESRRQKLSIGKYPNF